MSVCSFFCKMKLIISTSHDFLRINEIIYRKLLALCPVRTQWIFTTSILVPHLWLVSIISMLILLMFSSQVFLDFLQPLVEFILNLQYHILKNSPVFFLLSFPTFNQATLLILPPNLPWIWLLHHGYTKTQVPATIFSHLQYQSSLKNALCFYSFQILVYVLPK